MSTRPAAEILKLLFWPFITPSKTVPSPFRSASAFKVTVEPRAFAKPALAKFSEPLEFTVPLSVIKEGAVAVSESVNVLVVATAPLVPIVRVPVLLSTVAPATELVKPRRETL